jgi:DNA-binding CsgD family transcriptional regulator
MNGKKPECNCNQAWWVKHRKTGCPHWEALVNRPTNSHHMLVRRDNSADTAPSPEDVLLAKEADENRDRAFGEPIDPRQSDADVMVENLMEGGLSRRSSEVVAYRIVRGLTYDEIARELGYSGATSAAHVYDTAMKKLKANGYGVKIV